jgi:hypothetical protein
MTQPTTDHGHLEDLWRPRSSLTPAAGVDLASTPGAGLPAQLPPARRRFGRVFGEIVLATLLSVATAVAMGWQVLREPTKLIPGGGADPFIEIWSLAWSGHALNPDSGIPLTQIFGGNAFYPADYSLAFTDSLLGYGPITWFFHGASGLVLAYNLIFVLSPALSSLGGYALTRQLGANPIGAAVAGAGFAYAPWHTGQLAHLHVLSTGPLVIALAMLARGHGLTMSGTRSPSRPLWVLLGWIVAAWQLTIGFTGGLPFAYLVAIIAVLVLLIAPVRLIRAGRVDRQARAADLDPDLDPYLDPTLEIVPRPPTRPRRVGWLIVADLLGGALFAAVGAMMAYPYFRVKAIDPAAVAGARGLDQVRLNSPEPLGLLRPPGVDGTWSWLTSGQTLVSGSNEIRMLPGAILLGLALLGLVFSTWRWWWRLALAVTALLLAGLSLGTEFPGRFFPGPDAPFVLLWRHVPGWASDRTPGRLMVFATLALAVLAAGAVSRLCGWAAFGVRGRAPRLRAVALAVLPVLVVLEGWVHIPLLKVPPTPKAVAAASGPMVVLPSISTNDSRVMFWTATRGFPALANGASGITPTTEIAMRGAMLNFPDARSVAYLRANGFHSVAVLRQPLGTQLWANAGRVPDPSLGLTRTDLGDSVLFTVSAR